MDASRRSPKIMNDITDDGSNSTDELRPQELRRLLARWLTLDGERYHLKNRCDAKVAAGKKTPPGAALNLAELERKIQELERELRFLGGGPAQPT
jgi:hypothetical protein